MFLCVLQYIVRLLPLQPQSAERKKANLKPRQTFKNKANGADFLFFTVD